MVGRSKSLAQAKYLLTDSGDIRGSWTALLLGQIEDDQAEGVCCAFFSRCGVMRMVVT